MADSPFDDCETNTTTHDQEKRLNALNALNTLNAQQREVVDHRGSPLLVFAAVGTGKTSRSATASLRIAFSR